MSSSNWPVSWGNTVSEVVHHWTDVSEALFVAGASSCVWQCGSGEPVVCLHGVPASAFLYRKLLPALAAQGLRGIAFDFPGLGLADRPQEFDYSWTGLSGWAEEAVDALDLERFHLVVHDIGGPIGFDLIRRIPHRIKSLTVLNTLVKVATFHRPWSMEPFSWPVIGPLYLACTVGPALEMLMRVQGVQTDVPSAELRAYEKLLKRSDDGDAFLRIMRGFELTQEYEDRILPPLRKRNFPAQLIWGENDPALTLQKHAPAAQEALGLTSMITLPAKHFVPEDCPQEIAAAVATLAASS